MVLKALDVLGPLVLKALDVLGPLVLKGLGAPNPKVATLFEASPPNILEVEAPPGAWKPNDEGCGVAFDPSIVGLSTLAPRLGVKGWKETIGLLLVFDPKGLLEGALGAAAGVAALFTVRLFVDEALAGNPKLNLGWVDALPGVALDVA